MICYLSSKNDLKSIHGMTHNPAMEDIPFSRDMSTLVYKREAPSLTSLFLSVSGPTLFSPKGG